MLISALADVSGYGVRSGFDDAAHVSEPGSCAAETPVSIQVAVWSLARIRHESECQLPITINNLMINSIFHGNNSSTPHMQYGVIGAKNSWKFFRPAKPGDFDGFGQKTVNVTYFEGLNSEERYVRSRFAAKVIGRLSRDASVVSGPKVWRRQPGFQI